MPAPKRIRRSERDIKEILARFERSGLSQAAYCRRKRVPLSTFSYWRRSARPSSELSPQLLPVRIAAPVQSAPGRQAVEIVLPTGVVVRFENECRAELVSVVLSALESSC